MSQTIEIQLQNYDDHMTMKNFSVATRKMYLRTLIGIYDFINQNLVDKKIVQNLPSSIFYIERKVEDLVSQLIVITLRLESFSKKSKKLKGL